MTNGPIAYELESPRTQTISNLNSNEEHRRFWGGPKELGSQSNSKTFPSLLFLQ